MEGWDERPGPVAMAPGAPLGDPVRLYRYARLTQCPPCLAIVRGTGKGTALETRGINGQRMSVPSKVVRVPRRRLPAADDAFHPLDLLASGSLGEYSFSISSASVFLSSGIIAASI